MCCWLLKTTKPKTELNVGSRHHITSANLYLFRFAGLKAGIFENFQFYGTNLVTFDPVVFIFCTLSDIGPVLVQSGF